MVWLLLLACSSSEPLEAGGPAAETPLKLYTDDGATIALHHQGGRGRPVLLVHGISSNARYWDLDPAHSLADWLEDRDHDVWRLDLRGHGAARVSGDGEPQRHGWTIDDYGRHDVATAVAWILGQTGAPAVDFVGHSLGGMVGAIYATSGGGEHLANLVVLGSPAAFDAEDPLHTTAALALTGGGLGLLWFDTPFFAELDADWGDRLPVRAGRHLTNPENVLPATMDRVLREGTSSVSREEMAHLGRMLRHERFESADGTVDYAAALGKVRVPTLAIGGAADRVVPAPRVEAFAAAMGGPRRYVLAGRTSGMAADYGHLDFVLGERAREEIYPLIADWLR